MLYVAYCMQLNCQFLSRVSMPMHAERDIVMANLPVRPSVTLWYCSDTKAHIVKLFPPSQL